MTTASPSPASARSELLTVADRVPIHEAKRHFADGGAVIVSERGWEPTCTVYLGTTFHTRETTTWEALTTLVNEWRGRYPSQRYYILRPVDIPLTAARLRDLLKDHSRSLFEGLLDKNVIDSDHTREAGLAHMLARLLASAIAVAARTGNG